MLNYRLNLEKCSSIFLMIDIDDPIVFLLLEDRIFLLSFQIDVPFLDKTNSGLTYLAHNMKGSTKCAQITFTEKESVRSALATEALNRLM